MRERNVFQKAQLVKISTFCVYIVGEQLNFVGGYRKQALSSEFVFIELLFMYIASRE